MRTILCIVCMYIEKERDTIYYSILDLKHMVHLAYYDIL